MSKSTSDIFVKNKIYPKADMIFNTSLSPIEEIKNSCVFVLDTNALLLPYGTGSESLEEIKKVFERLKNQNRLVIPGQVAREFASIRPEKLKEIHQKLTRRRNSTAELLIGNYPLLESLHTYMEILELEQQINELIGKYRKNIGRIIDTVKTWAWNDPVSMLYQELFTPDVIHDLEFNEDEIAKQLHFRYEHKIPPGYKDNAKADDGIGDLLIWLSILEIAKTEKNVVFVTADEKGDWYYKSENQALYPRFELVSEFQSVSGGKSFHMMRMSELLKLMGADDQIIKEIEVEENTFEEPLFRQPKVPFEEVITTVAKWYILQLDYASFTYNLNFPKLVVFDKNGREIAVEVIDVPTDAQEWSRIRKYIMNEFQALDNDRFKTFDIIAVDRRNFDGGDPDVVDQLDEISKDLRSTGVYTREIYANMEGRKFNLMYSSGLPVLFSSY